HGDVPEPVAGVVPAGPQVIRAEAFDHAAGAAAVRLVVVGADHVGHEGTSAGHPLLTVAFGMKRPRNRSGTWPPYQRSSVWTTRPSLKLTVHFAPPNPLQDAGPVPLPMP